MIDNDSDNHADNNENHDRRFETVITEQTRDHRVAWRYESGPLYEAAVTIRPIDDDRSRVTFELESDSGDASGSFVRTIEGDLARFAALVPDRLGASSAWRGAVSAHETGLVRP